MNFYSENDPKAAAWLRELIRQGQIPKGVVDERSITEIDPDELTGFIQCHFFAGVAGWPLALKLAGWPEDREVFTGSPPCQPFSIAGQRKGRSDERHLWPAFRKLIAARRPKVVFGEQVASLDGRSWFGGYEGLQQLQDREAIVRILQTQGMLRKLPPDVQSLLQGSGTRSEGENSEREKGGDVPLLSTKESGEGVNDIGPVPSPKEGNRILSVAASGHYPRCHRCGRLRINRHPVQFGRGKNLEQSLSGQNRLFEGVYDHQCPCGALLRERDGEYVGREQDNRNCRRDNQSSGIHFSGFSDESRNRPQEAIQFSSLAGVRTDLEELGFSVGASDLCAAGISSPHIRQRLFWVAISRLERTGRRLQRPGESFATAGEWPSNQPGGSGAVERMEHTDPRGLRAGREHQVRFTSEGCDPQRLVQPNSDGCEPGRQAAETDRHGRSSEPAGGLEWMGSPIQPRLEGHAGNGDDRHEPGRNDSPKNRPAPAAGAWSDYQIIECEQGKYRRIESGTFPLADGVPARVVRLRGYGNAIVPQLAAEFILAAEEAIGEVTES